MTLSDKDILIASLLGSKMMERVPRLAVVQNELMKHPVPSVPFLPFKNDVVINKPVVTEVNGKIWQSDSQENQFFPLYIRRAGSDDPFFMLPYEPMISVSGKNNIVTRNIAKAPNFIGTIKEHFSQDDYEISITGSLFGREEMGSYDEAFPHEDFVKLKNYCISPTGLEVQCEFLQYFGVDKIVVKDFSFPFSKGENVQVYDIKALSDFSADFLLELED